MTICWVLSDEGKIGARNQCLGLAEALGLTPKAIAISLKNPWRFLPEWMWPCSLTVLDEVCHAEVTHTPSHMVPHLIIASGRRSVIPAYVLKKKFHCPVILLQKPHILARHFDLIVVPEHDRFVAPNALSIIGNTSLVTPSKIQEALKAFPHLEQKCKNKEVLALLLGGPNKAFSMSLKDIQPACEQMLHWLEEAPHRVVLASCSRRTPSPIHQWITSIAHPRFHLWDGTLPNPYLAYLELADVFIISQDSVAMTSEAASTGKPIYSLQLPGHSNKFHLFHKKLKSLGITRPFEGDVDFWAPTPLRETQRVAEIIRERGLV